MKDNGWLQRLQDELAQAWAVTVKDMKVYYLQPGMIMFGLFMPFFMFFSFSVKREMAAAQGVARREARTPVITAAAPGPGLLPPGRRPGLRRWSGPAAGRRPGPPPSPALPRRRRT